MGVKVQIEKNIVTAFVDGEIDHHSAAEIRNRIDLVVQKTKPKELHLDFGSVGFMDSSGIGLIIGRYKLVSELGGRLRICNANSTIMRMIKLGGISRLNILNETEV